jgi:3-oxoacyl-[acyl-carrier protein] reductase
MRRILVTGGSKGLGLGIAVRLARAGYEVIAVARQQTGELERGMSEIPRDVGALRFSAADLSDIEAIPDFVRKLRREFGPIYGLVNNAGMGASGLLANMHDARLGELIKLNVQSPITLTKYALRSMMAEGSGRIVNLASIVAHTGFKGLAPYAATKAAMIGFTRSLAREVGPLGINVNAIAPGFIETDMTQELGKNDLERIVQRSALRRLARVEDVAGAAEYLFSEAATNISGMVLTVDAGATA